MGLIPSIQDRTGQNGGWRMAFEMRGFGIRKAPADDGELEDLRHLGCCFRADLFGLLHFLLSPFFIYLPTGLVGWREVVIPSIMVFCTRGRSFLFPLLFPLFPFSLLPGIAGLVSGFQSELGVCGRWTEHTGKTGGKAYERGGRPGSQTLAYFCSFALQPLGLFTLAFVPDRVENSFT